MTGDAIIPINGKQVQVVVYGEFLGSVAFKRELYPLPFHGFVFLT